MKPKKAEQHLQLILDTQKTVSTERLRKMLDVIITENKMLRTDNRMLRKRVKNQREEIKKLSFLLEESE